MQLGFYFDQSRCIGCDTCRVACKDWHDVPAGPASWMRVTTIEQGNFPNVSVTFLALACLHCVEASCIPACPAGAISKREEDGIVVVDGEQCLGRDSCGMPCFYACPYQSPQFGEEENPKMQKCELCLERWSEGKKPICVEGCPMRALDAGPVDELIARYGDLRNTEGFVYSSELKPAIIFKASRPKQVATR